MTTADLVWHRTQPGYERCVVGALQMYRNFGTGVVSVAEHGSWISALFKTVEATLSWRDHWSEAEALFIKNNRQPLELKP